METSMKILIGYDGSRTADKAIEDLRTAGLPAKAQAYILTAMPPMLPIDLMFGDPAGSTVFSSSLDIEGLSASLKATAKKNVLKAVQALKKLIPGWTVTGGTCDDIAVHGLLAKADSWKPDMIVVGSNGWSAFGNLLLGSVADQLLRHAQTNVRIVRKGAKKASGRLNLLIGFDGSAHAEAAVAEVASRKWPKGSRVHILAASVFHLRLREIGQAVRKALHPKAADPGAWPLMERALDKAATRLRNAGLEVTPMITLDDPRKALVEHAKEMDADCIFLGSRGLSATKRILVGSVSGAVSAHAPCSVDRKSVV